MPRSLQIAKEFSRFVWLWWRHHRRDPDSLPLALRNALERLGSTFIKLGQALSVRADLLPKEYRVQLSTLQDHVATFPSAQAIAEVEAAFGQPVNELFQSFESKPHAAASIAQMHRATLKNGEHAIVKIRRPHTREIMTHDLRILRRLARVATVLMPRLRRQQPVALVDEIRAQLLAEIDFRHEARNVRRMVAVLADRKDVWVPDIVEPFISETVLVQYFSPGTPLSKAFGTEVGSRLARVVIDAYLYQLLIAGAYHADPHPGNFFVLPDGRLCIHDFGSMGTLDPRSRKALGLLFKSMAMTDASEALDAAIDLGLINGTIDRRDYERSIDSILGELAAAPMAEWSLADTMLRIARLGAGEHFVMQRYLLVLVRTLFLLESTTRLLDPQLKLTDELRTRRDALDARSITDISWDSVRQALVREFARSGRELPQLLIRTLHRIQSQDGDPGFALRHQGFEALENTVARTGNRLSLALVTLGTYIAASLAMLHDAGPMVWGHIPVLAVAGYVLAVGLTVRLVRAIGHSGHL